MLLSLTREAYAWLIKHAESGGEHQWRCKSTRREIRFVKVKQLIRFVPNLESAQPELVTTNDIHYPQCAQCPNEVRIGDAFDQVDTTDLRYVEVQRWTRNGRLI